MTYITSDQFKAISKKAFDDDYKIVTKDGIPPDIFTDIFKDSLKNNRYEFPLIDIWEKDFSNAIKADDVIRVADDEVHIRKNDTLFYVVSDSIREPDLDAKYHTTSYIFLACDNTNSFFKLEEIADYLYGVNKFGYFRGMLMTKIVSDMENINSFLMGEEFDGKNINNLKIKIGMDINSKYDKIKFGTKETSEQFFFEPDTFKNNHFQPDRNKGA